MGARLHDGRNWESVQGRMERRLFAGRASGARERRSPDGYRGPAVDPHRVSVRLRAVQGRAERGPRCPFGILA